MGSIKLAAHLQTFAKSVALIEGAEKVLYSDLVDQLRNFTSLSLLSENPVVLDSSWSVKNISKLLFALENKKIIIFQTSLDQISAEKLKQFEITRNKKTAHLVLSTSGTEGASKFVVQDLQQIAVRCMGPLKFQRVAAVPPLSTIGGIFTLMRTLMTGATLCLYSSLTVQNLFTHIDTSGAELLPLSPTLLRLSMLSDSFSQVKLASLQQINLGAEVVNTAVVEEFKRIYPHVNFKHVYGTTETGLFYLSSGTTVESFAVDTKLTKNIRINEKHLEIQSSTMMQGYLDDLVLQSEQQAQKVFLTHDIFEILEDQRLRLIGRSSQTVNLGGEKFSFFECERALLQIPDILFAVIGKESQALTGEFFTAAVYSALSAHELRTKIRSDWKRLNLNPKLLPMRIRSLTLDELNTMTLKARG